MNWPNEGPSPGATAAFPRHNPLCVPDSTPGVGIGMPTGSVNLAGATAAASGWFVTVPGTYRLTGGPTTHWDRGLVRQGGRDGASAEWLPDERLMVIGDDGKVAGSIFAGGGMAHLVIGHRRYRIVPSKGFIGGWQIFMRIIP